MARIVTADANAPRVGQLFLKKRQHHASGFIVEFADRLVFDDPKRTVQKDARQVETTLLVEGQLFVPAFLDIQILRKPREMHPFERAALLAFAKSARPVGVGEHIAQAAFREVGLLRQEHHVLREPNCPGSPNP